MESTEIILTIISGIIGLTFVIGLVILFVQSNKRTEKLKKREAPPSIVYGGSFRGETIISAGPYNPGPSSAFKVAAEGARFAGPYANYPDSPKAESEQKKKKKKE